jgi:hypothetical protein
MWRPADKKGLVSSLESEQLVGQGNSSLFQALEDELVALSTTVQQHSELVDGVELLSRE